MKNQALINEIGYWQGQGQHYKGIIKTLEPLFLTVDILSGIVLIPDLEIKKFVFGMISATYYCNMPHSEEYLLIEKDINDLVSPVLTKLTSHLKSETYQSHIIDQQISGTKTIEVDGAKELIDEKTILNHIKRTHKTPLTPKDVETIEKDFLDYFRQLNKISKPKSRASKEIAFRDLLLCDDETKESVISFIQERLKKQSMRNVFFVAITTALRQKGYIDNILNKAQYHRAASAALGDIGTLSGFNEHYGYEYFEKTYETQITDYIAKLP